MIFSFFFFFNNIPPLLGRFTLEKDTGRYLQLGILLKFLSSLRGYRMENGGGSAIISLSVRDMYVYRRYYRIIINDCPIAVGVENPHKFGMCRQLRNVRQTSRQIYTTASSATYRPC
jgi:hypothetical protein